jgi:negative regulator of flagellin synthesis FlgM
VELTPAALSLRRVDEELRSGPAFDAARVAELRNAIAAGTYTVDAGAVANGLIGLERLLGGR